jgi:hypothetical protein
MTQESYRHPITPPPELLKHWEDQHFDEGENYDVMLTQAYQAGADQELEACIAWFDKCIPGYELVADRLRAARRPKPPSLKEQAMQALSHLLDGAAHSMDTTEPAEYIRRALEQLPDNE